MEICIIPATLYVTRVMVSLLYSVGVKRLMKKDKLSFQFKALHLTATDRVSRNYWLILRNPKLYPRRNKNISISLFQVRQIASGPLHDGFKVSY